MNRLALILIAAVVLRLILAAGSFHSDVVHFDLAGWVLSSGHLLDFYDYLEQLPRDHPIVLVNSSYPFNYPPAIYLFNGLFRSLFSPLEDPSFILNFLINPAELFGHWQVNLHLLLLKVPYLFVDLLAAWVITKLFRAQSEKLLAVTIWLFNPINLHATYLMGQFDIIPTFLTLLSLVLVNQNKLRWAVLALGVGGAFKIYPLFFIIPVLLLVNGWTERAKLLLLGLIPYLLQLVIYFPSVGFKASALVANQTLKSFYAQIPISGGESIILFPTFLLLVYLIFYYQKIEKEWVWSRFFIILLIFFTFTHTHPQWFLWLSPFLIIDLIKSKFKTLPLLIITLISYLIHLSLFESSLTTQLFSPYFPNLVTQPRVWELLNLNVDQLFLRSLFQSLFTGASLFWVITYLLRPNPHDAKK